MTTHGMSTPGEVDVARDWLESAVRYLNGETQAYSFTVTDPFDATNNQTYHEVLNDIGDVPTAVAVAFTARQATWQAMWSDAR